MTTQDNYSPEMAAVMAQWMDHAAKAWNDLLQTRPAPEAPPGETRTAGEEKTRFTKGEKASEPFQWEAAFQNWRSFFESLAQPESTAHMAGFRPVPPVFTQLANSSWQMFANMQQSWTEQLKQAGTPVEGKDFAFPDEETLRRWSEFYDTEIRKYLTIPQIGLNKFSQENINRMIDRFHAKHLALAEFFELLYRPVKEGAGRMQEKIREWMHEGQMPDDPKAIYRQWLKYVEGRYMVLFRSDEFIRSLQKAVMATLEFHNARKTVMEEVSRYFSIPTSRDLDDVYRELHNLKQQVRTMENQLHEYTQHAASAAPAV